MKKETTFDLNPAGHKYYYLCAMVFVMSLIVANTVAGKIVSVGSFAVAAGIVVFPISYIFGDVLTEVYGYRQTRKVIWTGFLCLIAMSGLYYLASVLPPAPFYTGEAAFDQVFQFVPRIVLASISGYIVGSFLNAIVMSRMKVMTDGKWLWLRTIASTIVGEGADSFIFALVAFYGIFATYELFLVGFTGFVLKSLYEILATPITYAIVGFLKKAEGVDKYDREESYTII